MRLSDFFPGDKIYAPISTLHRLNIELDSISYIELGETGNQFSYLHRRTSVAQKSVCVRRPTMTNSHDVWLESIQEDKLDSWWHQDFLKIKLVSPRSTAQCQGVLMRRLHWFSVDVRIQPVENALVVSWSIWGPGWILRVGLRTCPLVTVQYARVSISDNEYSSKAAREGRIY